MTTTPNVDRMKELVANWEKHGKIFPNRSVKDCIAAGAMLLLIKENTPHGEFAEKLNRLGLHKNSGSRLIACTRNFQNRSEMFFTCVGSTSKLIELLCFERAGIDALERGEEVLGITLQSLQKMTVLELRKVLRNSAAADAVRFEGKLKSPLTKTVPRNTTTLSVDEERMLRDYRKCSKDAQALIGQTAKLLVK